VLPAGLFIPDAVRDFLNRFLRLGVEVWVLGLWAWGSGLMVMGFRVDGDSGFRVDGDRGLMVMVLEGLVHHLLGIIGRLWMALG